MKKVILLLLCVLLVSVVQAQEDTRLPRYAVAFRAENDILVAILYTDDTWEVVKLPQLMLLGQYDASLITPRWTPDGRLIGTGYAPDFVPGEYEPNYETSALHIYGFDPFSETVELLTPDPVIDLEAYRITEDYEPEEYLEIDEFSPDNRYVLANGVLWFDSHLVDLETGQVVFKSECLLDAVAWTESTVILGNDPVQPGGQCPSDVYEIDLSTGEKVRDLAAMIELNPYFNYIHGFLLDDGRLVLSNNKDPYLPIYLVDGDTATDIGIGYKPVLWGDKVAYVNDYWGLQLYDLASGELTEITPAGTIEHWVEGDTLHYWHIDGGSSGRVYTRGTLNPDSTTVFYSGPDTSDEVYLPDALIMISEDSVQVYTDGGLQWDSRETFAGETPGLVYEGAYPQMSDNSLRFGFITDLISVNWQTGEQYQSDTTKELATETPDGSWWLYVIPGDEYRSYSILEAYNLATGETVVLHDGARLHISYGLPLYRHFPWSPELNPSPIQ